MNQQMVYSLVQTDDINSFLCNSKKNYKQKRTYNFYFNLKIKKILT